MTDPIDSIILDGLGDAGLRFVFPSEVAARARLEWALQASGRRALPVGRFMSWDAFKALAFPGPEEGQPASAAIRSIFARALMEENAKTPFLTHIIPREQAVASSRFARSVAKALPALRPFDGALNGPGGNLRDWRAIRERYASFLAERSLYEPGWNSREARPLPGDWALLCPDCTTDWQEYGKATLALPRCRVFLSSSLEGGTPRAAAYPTLLDEIRSTLLSIRKDLAEGVDPAGIMISIASPESTLPLLRREARVAGIDLDIREARPLSESAGGRLLRDILELSRSKRSFAAMRSLLLDRSRPLSDPDAARALIDLGIRKHILCSLPGQDAWELSMGEKDEAERRLYRGLRAACDKIAGAKGFGQLRSAFDAFRRAYIDETHWTAAQNDEIARCIRELEALGEAAKRAELGQLDHAAEAFAEELEELRYLPVSARSGIAVYRFPVAAGCKPLRHYVLNLSEGAAQAAARPLSFLRDDEREALGARDLDISAGLITLLAGSGERVALSCSEDGPDGIRPPHPILDTAAAGGLGMPDPSEAWLPELSSGRSLFPIQASSAKAAVATVFPPAGRAYSQGRPGSPSFLETGIRQRVLAAASPEGLLDISDTLIEELASCPFRRLFARYLGVGPVETGLSFVDALMEGNLYHETFERLFKPLADASLQVVAGTESGECTRPSVEDIPEALDEAIASQERKHGPFAGMLLRTERPAFLRDLERALLALLPVLDGWTPELVEGRTMTARLSRCEGRARLAGRMDLVCVKRGTDGERPDALIVDFKKNRLPGEKELIPDDEGRLAKCQMPAYAILCEQAGYSPKAAYYLSVEASSGARLRCAFGEDNKPAVQLSGLGELLAAFERAAVETAELMESGAVYVPDDDAQEDTCKNCGYRSICRVRYTVR